MYDDASIYEKFIRERITNLRIKKNISEYRMSLDLGHSTSYIRSISSGKSLPSMGEFLYICEYLGTSPQEFFYTEIDEPILVKELYNESKDMSAEDLNLLLTLAKRLKQK